MKKVIYTDIPRPYDKEAGRLAAIGIFLLICAAITCVMVVGGL